MSNSRISMRMPVATFWTVPMIRPSAFSSRQRSKGTSVNPVAAGIVA
jgi:hypothetical protein